MTLSELPHATPSILTNTYHMSTFRASLDPPLSPPSFCINSLLLFPYLMKINDATCHAQVLFSSLNRNSAPICTMQSKGFQVKPGEQWEVNLSSLAPLILHGKQNLGHTMVRVLGSNLLVTSLNKLCVYLAILF